MICSLNIRATDDNREEPHRKLKSLATGLLILTEIYDYRSNQTRHGFARRRAQPTNRRR